MRHLTLTHALGMLMLLGQVKAQSGLFVSFQSRFPIPGTSAGLRTGPLAVFGGLDIFRISANYDYESTTYQYDFANSLLYKYRETTTSFKGSAQLVIPRVGARFYLGSAATRFYLLGDIMLIIPAVEARAAEKTVYYNPNGTLRDTFESDEELTDEDKKSIHDALDFISLALGLGAEYALSEHFAIGGEYGLRIFFNSFEDEDEYEEDFDGVVHYRDLWKSSTEAALGITYTSFSLNYYF